MNSHLPLVSVVIPVYNAEKWLDRCIKSVIDQTYTNWEIVAIDDGSTDDSFSILKKYLDDGINLKLHQQKNSGQGVARNKAVTLTKGEYILFLDSDDFLEPVTFQVCISRAIEDKSDLVHFDWKTASKDDTDPYKYNYFNNEPYWNKKILTHSECGHLVRMGSYFTVTNMYKKAFLNKWDIKYDEEHIYEDVLFMVQVASRAEKVSLVHSPLYTVQPNPESTTKSNTHTDKHYLGHIHAVKASFDALNPRFPLAKAYLAKYHTDRFVLYSNTRVPVRFRRAYARDFVSIISEHKIELSTSQSLGGFFDKCISEKVFENKQYFKLLLLSYVKHHYGSQAKNINNAKDKGFREIFRVLSLARKKTKIETFQRVENNIDHNVILFLGFDYRYVGNSKYLFQSLVNNQDFSDKKIFFATKDTQVNAEYRLEPGSTDFNNIFKTAGVVIAESWVSLNLTKTPGSHWVQLWHGTPMKKVLFDSNEPNIIERSPRHKIAKYRDIIRWDSLVVDDSLAVEKFKSCFLFPDAKILRTGYPRVNHISSYSSNDIYKNKVKSDLGISFSNFDKKIVLYAPTWRDYNIGVAASKKDFKYLMNLELLSQVLGDEYVILFSDHSFMKSAHTLNLDNVIHTGEVETQDVLLVSDIVISDYSSIIFDLVGTDKSVILYTPDLIKFDRSRGVYSDIIEALYKHQTSNFNGVIELIKKDTDLKIDLAGLDYVRYVNQNALHQALMIH